MRRRPIAFLPMIASAKPTSWVAIFQSTRARTAGTDGAILVLHDTTEFSYQRERPEAIGLTYKVNSGRDKAGRSRLHTVCGIL
jgi:hypothetical protein